MRFIFSWLIFLNLLFVATVYASVETKAEIAPSVKQILEDTVITTKIKAKIIKNRYLNPLKISVSTTNGLVRLTGFVKDKQAYVKALRLVKNTNGVKQLEVEHLVIKDTNTALTDAYITTKVEAAILKAKVLHDDSIPLVGINASTSNGEVTLSGTVKSKKIVITIIKQVNTIDGVKKIISNLTVESEHSS